MAGYCSFELAHGDVTTIPADLLVISTHADSNKSLSDQLIGTLKKDENDLIAALSAIKSLAFFWMMQEISVGG